MKKSTFYAIASLMIVFLVLSTFSRKTKIYEKEINFNTPEEAISSFIGYANAYERIGTKGTYINMAPTKFLESLSRRYRLFIKNSNDARFIYGYIPSFYSYDLEEIDEKLIKEEYENSFDKIPNYKRAKDIRFYRLDGNSYYYNKVIDMELINDNGTVSNDYSSTSTEELDKTSLYLVVIDEGEGYVVDYYQEIYLD
ncbi:hypothetical protein [Clostridium isatidis]|uniref:Uncharacterized protein n=1 Tax=Clostridium isatidis TaxID=182773 RepID=A0A343JDD8_9CLOT|nr:hypothetical protein [Clostridium isatidis]ASW43546.1 hypothetical protein BEN51_08640 [Clostridium isatidis]